MILINLVTFLLSQNIMLYLRFLKRLSKFNSIKPCKSLTKRKKVMYITRLQDHIMSF